MKMRNILVFFYEKYQGDWGNIYMAIAMKERVDPEEAKECYNRLSCEYKITTIIDADYPEFYKKDYPMPPFVILEPKTNNALC